MMNACSVLCFFDWTNRLLFVQSKNIVKQGIIDNYVFIIITCKKHGYLSAIPHENRNSFASIWKYFAYITELLTFGTSFTPLYLAGHRNIYF
jgi:hypothetical protein